MVDFNSLAEQEEDDARHVATGEVRCGDESGQRSGVPHCEVCHTVCHIASKHVERKCAYAEKFATLEYPMQIKVAHHS